MPSDTYLGYNTGPPKHAAQSSLPFWDVPGPSAWNILSLAALPSYMLCATTLPSVVILHGDACQLLSVISHGTADSSWQGRALSLIRGCWLLRAVPGVGEGLCSQLLNE